MTDTATGACYCDSIRFEVVFPTKWCGHCHCTICQRIHGAALVTWVGCHEESVTIVDEDSQLYWYCSSGGSERGSCRQCGTQLFFRSDKWPGELHIVRTAFLSPIDREPSGHSYYQTHASWLTLNDDLPTKK